jgi:iron complex outermembrane receptor protein
VWSADLSGNASNRVLAGFDYSTDDSLSRSALLRGFATPRAGFPCPLTFLDPVYRACDPGSYDVPAQGESGSDTRRYGFYLLNELTLGPVIAVAGIRTDTFDDSSVATSGAVTTFKGSDETYRLGLVWRVREDVSLYGQYATSFEPQSASSQMVERGGPFAPTTGNMFEGGLKTALMDDRIQTTVALYRIVRRNLLQSTGEDPEGDGFENSIAFGEVTSKGIDFDLATDLTPNWVLTLNYSYNHTRVTQDNGNPPVSVLDDNKFANAPAHKLGFWTRYQFPRTGFAFALGGDYVGKRLSLSNQPVNPYMVFDASITWTEGPLEMRLRVDNLFDKTYAASGFNDRGGHFPGRPRSAFVEAGYRF